MFKLKILLLFIALPLLSSAQQYNISGYVKEGATGETMIGANVFIKETLKGTTTNQYGFYSLTVPSGNVTLVISYLGFVTQQFPLVLDKDIRQNVELATAAVETKEVTITAEKEDRNVQSAE